MWYNQYVTTNLKMKGFTKGICRDVQPMNDAVLYPWWHLGLEFVKRCNDSKNVLAAGYSRRSQVVMMLQVGLPK